MTRSKKRLSDKKRSSIFVRDRGKCRYCGSALNLYGVFHIDHVFPESRSGSNKQDNLVLSCGDCNIKKGARTPEEARMPLIVRFTWNEEIEMRYKPDNSGSRIWRRLHLLDNGSES